MTFEGTPASRRFFPNSIFQMSRDPDCEHALRTSCVPGWYRRFARACSKDDYSGNGLFIAKQFIDEHGGEIRISSLAGEEGHGTPVWVFLPLKTTYKVSRNA